jgi:gentisate 1,2-dioxygenase
MTTFKITKKHYDTIKKIADDNDISILDTVDLFFDYIFDNDFYETWDKPFINAKEEMEIATTYRLIDEWSERYESKPSTIFEYMFEEIEEFKTDYELI